MTTSALIFCTKSKTKTATSFCGVDIDMDQCAECSKRDARSAAKLNSQTVVHGTRGAEYVAVLNFSCIFYYIIDALTTTTMPMIKYSSTLTTTKFLMPLLWPCCSI